MTAAGGELAPGLYVVSTPIGNLGDLTFRALEVLKGCDLILAEDTRVTAKLLAAYGVRKRVERYDDHADARRRASVLAALAEGGRLALVSDAGTPLISDPGYRLVRAAAEAGRTVVPVPGASALLAAVAVAGLPTDRFLFAGFAPPRGAARRAFLAELAPIRATLVLYETGPRLRACLLDMLAVLGEREAATARELTKLYETVIRGPLSRLADDPRLEAPRGEIVVVVAPGAAPVATDAEIEAALREALRDQGPSAAAAEVARRLGVSKSRLYRLALEVQAK